MNSEDFETDLRLPAGHDKNGTLTWKSPSNIALIKYWGKSAPQLPKNPNVSLTLRAAHTITTLAYGPKSRPSDSLSVHYLFEGKEDAAFSARISNYLEQIKTYVPWIDQLELSFSSTNSFPHSSGIASSASSMSAIALCLCSLEQAFFNTLSDRSLFFKKASFLARLGSGSAARSVYPVASAWGHTIDIPEASDLYGVDLHQQVHQSVIDAHDTICLVHTGQKSVSSSAGHALMDHNPYADIRFGNARRRMHRILPALKEGDWECIGSLMEQEALELHALMMTSSPSYILMKPGTLAIIDRLYAFRADTKLPVYFTLDAGPNVHIIYPPQAKDVVQDWIAEEVAPFCQDGRYLLDEVGEGPEIIS